jgi:hypothetical protein
MSIFDPILDFISRRRNAYCLTFKGPLGQEVLCDLARFCRARESTFHPDPRLHAVAEGRREVWLRISNHLRMTDDELYELLRVNAPQPPRSPNA